MALGAADVGRRAAQVAGDLGRQRPPFFAAADPRQKLGAPHPRLLAGIGAGDALVGGERLVDPAGGLERPAVEQVGVGRLVLRPARLQLVERRNRQRRLAEAELARARPSMKLGSSPCGWTTMAA